MSKSPEQKAIDLLVELTSVPTAAGREGRVVRRIERWAAERPVELTRDAAGNITIARRGASGDAAPVYFTAHLDHPAFVVDRIVAPSVVQASFRGGVMEPYFRGGRVVAHGEEAPLCGGAIVETTAGEPFRSCTIELDDDAADRLGVGGVLMWDVGPSEVLDGLVHAPACDDLAAAAAALAAFDRLLGDPSAGQVRLLFTVAEEVGFIGAIAACKLGSIPKNARLIALENSRSFADSPIGGGPIVRVGDRISTFHPELTRAVGATAEKLAGLPDRPVGDAGHAPVAPRFQFQRKLMPGGACEASAFGAYGYEATCVCLPLGNYHNMAELDRVQGAAQRGEKDIPARAEREFISIADYLGLVELLVACAKLSVAEPLSAKMEKLYAERGFVLGAGR